MVGFTHNNSRVPQKLSSGSDRRRNEIEEEPLIKRKGPSKNTQEQINNPNIYVGLDNDFMRNNHIACAFYKEMLLISLLYVQVRLRVCDLKVDLQNRNSQFIAWLQFSALCTY